MDKIFVAGLLALIPFINFFLKYYFSYKQGDLKLFKKHFSTYYLDWIFVPFNFLWIYTFNLNIFTLAVFGFLSFFIFLICILFWIRTHKKEKKQVYLFDIKNGKIKLAGFVELLFFIIELTLILGFVFSSVSNIFVFYEILILFSFLLLGIPSSIFIHGKMDRLDLFAIILGVLVLIAKGIIIF